MKKLPLYIIIFLSLIILILFYNLFVSENGYKERDNLIIENQELTNRNDIIKNANEELIFEIVNAQDNEEHIENYDWVEKIYLFSVQTKCGKDNLRYV